MVSAAIDEAAKKRIVAMMEESLKDDADYQEFRRYVSRFDVREPWRIRRLRPTEPDRLVDAIKRGFSTGSFIAERIAEKAYETRQLVQDSFKPGFKVMGCDRVDTGPVTV